MSRGASAASCVLAVLALAAAAPSRAAAQSVQDFEIARAAYEARDFPRAVQFFEELVGTDPPRLSSPALVHESRKYLGAAYLFLGQSESAERQFELLLRDDPGARLDPLLFPSEVQQLFRSVRERIALEEREAQARRGLEAEVARERARAQALLAIAADPVLVEVESSRWAALVPFGAGQFLNGDDGLGWMFFTAEALLIGTAFGSLAIHDDLIARTYERREAGDRTGVALGNDYLLASSVVNWISLGSLAIFVIAGIVQAQIAFVPSRSIRHERPIPDELREGLDDPDPEDQEAPVPAPSSGVRIELGIPLSIRF